MKKILSMLLICVLGTFCFIYAEESDDSQPETDMENQLLQAFGGEESDSTLDALQDSNDLITEEDESSAQEKERIEREKEQEAKAKAQKKKEIRKKKSENKTMLGSIAVGANAPFTLNTSSNHKDKYNTPIPAGISAYIIGNFNIVAFKTNCNWDFIKAVEDDSVRFSWIASLGLTPIHNDYCFIGFYGTLGLIDKIEKYEYTSYGGSVNMLVNLSDNFGLLMNLDATYRGKAEYKGDEEIAPYVAHYLNTWRVCPSIGFFYTFIK